MFDVLSVCIQTSYTTWETVLKIIFKMKKEKLHVASEPPAFIQIRVNAAADVWQRDNLLGKNPSKKLWILCYNHYSSHLYSNCSFLFQRYESAEQRLPEILFQSSICIKTNRVLFLPCWSWLSFLHISEVKPRSADGWNPASHLALKLYTSVKYKELLKYGGRQWAAIR